MFMIESSMCIVTKPLFKLGRALHLVSFYLIDYQNVCPNGMFCSLFHTKRV